jgi:hypothetical protein
MNLFPRLAGLLLLLIHACGSFALVPLAAAVVAMADGEHGVEISAGRDGVHVVLRHDRRDTTGAATLPPGHQHRGFMRLLAGTADGNSHPDHDLFFAGTGTQETAKSGLLYCDGEDAESHLASSPAGCMESARLLDRETSPVLATENWYPPAPMNEAWGCVVLLI